MDSKKVEKKESVVQEQSEVYFEEDRYELIDNVQYELKPSPTVSHQKLVVYLMHSLYTTCQQEGVILVAPLDVYLDESNIVQPDVIYIANENAQIIKEKQIEGAPDLIVEILSPSTSKKDKILKKAKYEQFCVREYWIVDPVHFIVDQFVLKNGELNLLATFADGDILISDRFPCIRVILTNLFKQIR